MRRTDGRLGEPFLERLEARLADVQFVAGEVAVDLRLPQFALGHKVFAAQVLLGIVIELDLVQHQPGCLDLVLRFLDLALQFRGIELHQEITRLDLLTGLDEDVFYQPADLGFDLGERGGHDFADTLDRFLDVLYGDRRGLDRLLLGRALEEPVAEHVDETADNGEHQEDEKDALHSVSELLNRDGPRARERESHN